jgi:ribonuclease Z
LISADPSAGPCGPGELLIDLLGSGSAVPTAERDTTSLLIGAPDGYSLLECPGGIVHKLARRGLRPADLRRLILSHDHVDHVYGFPHLMHALAISGERAPLEVAAPAQCLHTVRAMVAAHRLDRPHYPPIREVEIALREGFALPGSGATRIRCAPAQHGRETVSVRFDGTGEGTGASLCYSADTRPCEALARLARGADVLLHDCGGPHRLRERFGESHASAREAGQAAANATVGRLVLLHLSVSEPTLVEECRREAADAFGGEVMVASDGTRWCVAGGS